MAATNMMNQIQQGVAQANNYNQNPYQYYYPTMQPTYVQPNNMYSGQQMNNQNYIQQQMPQQNMQPPQISSDRIWVQGETSAKSYLVAKNTEQVLWDNEQPSIYIKTIDAYGRPNMIILDYTIRPVETQNNGVANNEVSDLKKEIAELKDAITSLSNQHQQRSYKPNYNKKEVANND